MNTFAAAAVATAVVAALLAPPLDDQAALLERGRACVQRYDAGELAPLWDAFSPEMQKFLSLESLTAFREQTRAQLGTETADFWALPKSGLPADAQLRMADVCGRSTTFLEQQAVEAGCAP